MFSVVAGTATGVSPFNINQTLATTQLAADYWARYIDVSAVTLTIEVNFLSLGAQTLAQAGTDYYYDRSANGFDYYEPATIIELQGGGDSNGSAADISIDVNTDVLNANEFGFGQIVDGYSLGEAGKYDLWTILVHEIAHGLGLLSFIDEGGIDRSSFDAFVYNNGGGYYFVPPPSSGYYNIALDSSIAHTTFGVLSPSIDVGEVFYLTKRDFSIFSTIGAPMLKPTSGNDLLSGFGDGTPLNGLGGDDTITGMPGVDYFNGGDGNDSLMGSIGFDTLIGGAGADTLDGGAGIDTADYMSAAAGIVIIDGVGYAGEAAGDSLVGIEVIEGSAYSDVIDMRNAGIGLTLIANGGDNLLVGGSGNDSLYSSGAGINTLVGGAGNDTISAGSEDVISYFTSITSITIDIAAGIFGGAAVGDIIQNPVKNIEGSLADDSVAGDSAANNLSGLAGDDTLVGRDGDDLLRGGAGADSIDGGPGNDLADYRDAQSAVMIDFATTGTLGDAAGDILVSIEGVIGSSFGDTLIGSSGADYFEGGDGADSLDGGAGNDWASYADSAGQGASVNLATGATGGWAAGDLLISIENLIGTSAADNFTGDANDNIFSGGDGADTMNGGAGADTADYSASAGAVTIKLWAGTGEGGDAQGDVLSKIENLVGSAFNDRLIGLFNQNNVFHGGNGADFFDGFAGSDSIYGEAGDDRIIGGAGADFLDGGAGVDIASYGASQSGVSINLFSGAASRGDAAGDALFNFEGAIGSAFADYLVGNNAYYNVLQGNGGADTLDGAGGFDLINGGNGADLIIGGAGDDTLRGGLHDDTFRFAPGQGADTIQDFGVGGATGNDVIELKGYGAAFDTFAEVMAVASQQGASTLIDFGGGNSIAIANINVGALNAADFLFS